MDRNPQDPGNQIMIRLVDQQLTDFAMHAAATLGWESSCSITMELEGRPRRTASSDALSAACDDIEVSSGLGPCLDAMLSRQVVSVDDIRFEERWPAWTRTTKAAGFLSAGAFPGHTQHGGAVAVNVYRTDIGPWHRDDVVRADMYAQQVARVLDLCQSLGDAQSQRAELESAMRAQRSIDHAIGVVMATSRCDAATALELLRSGAASRSVALSDVAATVLQSLVPRTPEPTAG
ncbi:GAF and ANTAR domain-containing protein [Cellulomonas endometrii]|uniref:GAF and ANTAR domain-containing protein n=1 Tax=Cellulomonas endometrii TaxID=3036301 RepID=UPI0024AD3F4A|nr:GAF and ANTAR domain-containing protein [Cellulomonas endometrii]